MNQKHDNISDASVLIIGFDNQEANALVSMVRAAGVNSLETCGSVAQINNCTAASSAFTQIFVNFDAFDDVDSAVTALLTARMLRRDIIFVLVSKAVARDDLSSERMFICDVTLRSPVSFERMCEGLLAARVNNEIFTSPVSGPPDVKGLQKQNFLRKINEEILNED